MSLATNIFVIIGVYSKLHTRIFTKIILILVHIIIILYKNVLQ